MESPTGVGESIREPGDELCGLSNRRRESLSMECGRMKHWVRMSWSVSRALAGYASRVALGHRATMSVLGGSGRDQKCSISVL